MLGTRVYFSSVCVAILFQALHKQNSQLAETHFFLNPGLLEHCCLHNIPHDLENIYNGLTFWGFFSQLEEKKVHFKDNHAMTFYIVKLAYIKV